MISIKSPFKKTHINQSITNAIYANIEPQFLPGGNGFFLIVPKEYATLLVLSQMIKSK
ncbi:MAG: hypothetical protein ACRDDW_01065 [Candidatus Rhabdochlamydia sp.]